MEPILRLHSHYLIRLTISIESHISHSTFRHCVITIAVYGRGSVHNARIFANSKLNHMLKYGTIPPCRAKIPDEVPVFIIGDPAYLLMPYLTL